jgi:hypothetical protein
VQPVTDIPIFFKYNLSPTHDVVEPSGETDHVASTSSSARTQVTQPGPGTSRPNKRKRKGDELLLLEAKRFLGAR